MKHPFFRHLRHIRRLRPSSLLGQMLFTICAGLLILQGINLVAVKKIQESYFNQTNHNRIREAAVHYLGTILRPPHLRAGVLGRHYGADDENTGNIALTILPDLKDWSGDTDSPMAKATLSELSGVLSRGGRLSPPETHLRLLDKPSSPGAQSPHVKEALARQPDLQFPMWEIAMELDDNTWLSIIQPLGFNHSRLIWVQRVQLLALSLLLAILLFVVLARVTRPLRRLGLAAEQFGRQPDLMPPLPEGGTREVREATRAFNQMRKKISNNLIMRDRILAALAHDLRTPLTRLSLRLEDVEPESLREKIMCSCQEMQAIFQHGLELAQNPHSLEDPVSLDLGALLESLADDATDAGREITWLGPSPPGAVLRLRVRPMCLKRCLQNLLENAWRYAGRAELAAAGGAGKIIIEVRDRGPGIPEDDLEQIFEPYYRVESSRNRDFGGSGLGLTIARKMALLNGGQLTLHNRPGGGLIARLELPAEEGLGGGGRFVY